MTEQNQLLTSLTQVLEKTLLSLTNLSSAEEIPKEGKGIKICQHPVIEEGSTLDTGTTGHHQDDQQ